MVECVDKVNVSVEDSVMVPLVRPEVTVETLVAKVAVD